MAVAILPVLVLLAGCMVDDAAERLPQTYPWGISDCAFVIARVPVAPATVQPYLASGFRPVTSDATGMAEVHVDAYSCQGGVGLAGEALRGVGYGSVYVPAEPPEELREPGYDAYFVKLDFLVPEAARRTVLEAGGLPARAGHAAVRPNGLAWHAELAMGDAGGFVLDGVAPPPAPSPGALPFVEYTPLEGGGLARWHARLHDASIAEGSGLLQPTGLARHLVGADAVPAQFIAGTWNLDEADVTFPISWP